MALLTVPGGVKVGKPALTFSIDKIMGNNRAEISGTEEKQRKGEITSKSAKDAGSNNVAKPSNRRKRLFDEKCENDKNEKGFQPVRNLKTDHGIYDEIMKHQVLMAAQYQHAAALLTAETNKHHVMSFIPRDFYDVNRNAFACVHPAFAMGRTSKEEYRAHLMHNFHDQHNWSHVVKNKDVSYDGTDFLNSVYPQMSRKSSNPETDYSAGQQNLDYARKYVANSEKQAALDSGSDETSSDSSGVAQVPEPDVAIQSPSEESSHGAVASRKTTGKAQKSFSCPECGKLFNAHYNLTRHMPVHTGRWRPNFKSVYICIQS
ncbi:hypothetical protein DPMN_129754 [Dreissena polymorpha]|uniref:C2H2-type domain-containing protein n=1 Tax=Dreissena polymorpha TaxID=45954 RepID=A0A9D4JXP6_DREPO|nr:hypothetical protein DPMN_129754 [Dreissena polymorpha]